MIKNFVFDLGGVVIAINADQALRRFEEIGVKDAAKWLNPYEQAGFFGDLEAGRISAETFREKLSAHVGREVSVAECKYAWTGFLDHVPTRGLEILRSLRAAGRRVLLLSNTNPFMMMWAMSAEFDGNGHPLSDYFDACYLSYECRMMKPAPEIFRHMLECEHIASHETLFIDDSQRNVDAARLLGFHTLCPQDAESWYEEVSKICGTSGKT
ncbi:MAG: HAD family phosphatase [Bacteroidaceae bacterium]|nr:HAD family phosphatase [Bacteroidaceae bacterium]